MTQPAILGGLFIGVLSALPLINLANCCCLWVIGGGALTAWLDQQNQPAPITAGRGALAGLLAGVVGAVVWLAAAGAVDIVMAPLQGRMIALMLENARDMPPDVRVWLEGVGDRAAGPLRYVLGFFFQLLAGVTFGTLGGVLGAMFFRRETPFVPPPAMPPPLPPDHA